MSNLFGFKNVLIKKKNIKKRRSPKQESAAACVCLQPAELQPTPRTSFYKLPKSVFSFEANRVLQRVNCQVVGGSPPLAASAATFAPIASAGNAPTPAGEFKKWTALQPTFTTLSPLL